MNKTDESFKDFVLDQLQGLPDVADRRMFGSFALYQEQTCFGVVSKGKLYFKIDEATVVEYRKRKMKPFRPNAKQTIKSYYQVPVDVLENSDELCEWGKRAVESQKKKGTLKNERTGQAAKKPRS